jgi:3-oxoacyl-[acyl-carrier protein] reductase
VRQTLAQFSTLDILVNSAGVPGPVGALQDPDVSYWRHTIQVNLLGTYLCCRAVLPVMLRQGRGKLINFSGAGGRALRHVSAYVSSKAAIERLTETLSLELAGTNIQVNVMGPGAHRTRMVEELLESATAVNDTQLIAYGQQVLARRDSMERAAALAVFLASEASGNLSGRLIDAVRDDFLSLAPRIPQIMASDAYTLRRVEGE